MLSIGKCTAAMAGNYYEQERGYYQKTRDGDAWQGKLCKKMGIDQNKINPQQFAELLSNQKRAGFDLTFSADKSISVAAQLSPEIEKDMIEAHRLAVAETLKTIESEIGTRVRGIDGKREQVFVKTGNAAIAKVEHLTSRELDPDLHTHCVILNQTEYNNKIYALDAHKLYENKMRYGLEYRRRLAQELQRRGYDLELSNSEKGFFRIKDIRQDVCDFYSKRRAQIENQLVETGETGGRAADRANQRTRKVKDHSIDIEEKRTQWRAELAEMGQEIPLKNQFQKTRNITQERAEAVQRAIDRLSEKQFAFRPEELEKNVMNAGVLCGIDENVVKTVIEQNKDLIRLNPTPESGLSGIYYSTRDNLFKAQEIERMAIDGRNFGKSIDPKRTETVLQNVCQKNNWSLGDQQKAVVRHIATNSDQFIAVRGLAGTGKTFTMNVVREVLENEGFEVRGMSTTGQAAKELAEDAHIKNCATIHHQLNSAEREAGNAIKGEDYATKKVWNFNGIKSNAKPVVWFVDEASLTNNNLFYHIQKLAVARGDKVVFIGDDKQMLPVGEGNAFGELLQRKEISTVELNNIIRQKDPELLKAVQQAVAGDTKVSLDILSDDIREIKQRGHRLNAVAREYCNLTADEQAKTLVLTARNSDRVTINNKIRERLIKAGKLGRGKIVQIQPDAEKSPEQRSFARGDKVVFLRNDVKMGVSNGTKAIVENFDGQIMTVRAGEKSIEFNVNDYKAFDHGYAVTPHKGQGATVDKAIIHMSSADALLNSKNSFYVDISRAKHNVKVFVDDRKKLDPQIAKFAKKITDRDFKPIKPVKISGISANRSSLGAIVHGATDFAGKAVDITKKIVSNTISKISLISFITPKQPIPKITVKTLTPGLNVGNEIAQKQDIKKNFNIKMKM